jgi:hypothetical protein
LRVSDGWGVVEIAGLETAGFGCDSTEGLIASSSIRSSFWVIPVIRACELFLMSEIDCANRECRTDVNRMNIW